MQSDTRHAIIMAGGKGTRLAPYTTVLPKPLMPVHEQPILEIVIRQLRYYGFRQITISVGHLAELIQAFFGRGERWGVEIQYAIEDRPLGTMGALRNIALPDEPFLVMNGDILTDLDYSRLYDDHLRGHQLLTIASYRRHVDISLGVLEYGADRLMTDFREKPRMQLDVSMGVYIVSPSVLELMPNETPYGFDHLVRDLLRVDQPPRVFPFDGLWLDIGRREDYEAATESFLTHEDRFLPMLNDTEAKASAVPSGVAGR